MPADEHLALADRWIFSRLAAVTREMEEALKDYRFHEAAFKIYHFFWHEFCDWYVEWVKPEITRPADGEKVPPVWINLGRVFEASLHLLHPFMPFITEELWHLLPQRSAVDSISLKDFRLVTERVADPISEKQFEKVQELVVTARNAKAEMGLQKVKPSLQVASEDLRLLEIFRTHQDTILRLAAIPGDAPDAGPFGRGSGGRPLRAPRSICAFCTRRKWTPKPNARACRRISRSSSNSSRRCGRNWAIRNSWRARRRKLCAALSTALRSWKSISAKFLNPSKG
jgi:hypothetical protein